MATFAEAIDSIQANFHLHLSYISRTVSADKDVSEARPNLDGKSGLISWNESCSYIASLVKKYPTGVTKSIILTELEKRFNPRTKALANRANPDQHIQKEWKNITINSIAETKQVNINAVVECYIEDGFFLAGTKTRVVRLTDKTKLFSKSSLSEVDRRSVEMYLHQKLYQLEKKFSEHELKVTNLRIHRVGKSEAYRILPTEYFVILLNRHENKEFINSNFSTFKGIQNEENAPHYTRNVLMKVTNIDPVETIYYPDGSNAKRCIVDLIDKDRIEAKFMLWEEHTAFRNLFDVDDMLAIEKPFCVTENETFFVEYGSLTIIHLIPAETTKELVASQAKQAQSFHVSKTASGKLDYFLYPMRIYTMDIQEDMINVTLVGVITYKTPKLVFEDSDQSGHTFTVSLTDEYGSIKLTVLDHQCYLHGSLHVGQMIIAENFAVNGSGECELRTWGSGKISNICGMKGYLTSPCLYKLSHFDMMKDPGNYVCKATIVGIEPVKKEIVKRCHSSCLEPVSVSRGSFSCETCEVKVMKEANLSKLKRLHE